MYDGIGKIKTAHWWTYVNHASRDPMRPTHMKIRKDCLGLMVLQWHHTTMTHLI